MPKRASKKSPPRTAPPGDKQGELGAIQIIGARENNLQNLTVSIPKGRFVAVTGPSGSGKSSLVFQTVFGEAAWRSSLLSPDCEDSLNRPKVERITGLSHGVAFSHHWGGGSQLSSEKKRSVGAVSRLFLPLKRAFQRGASPLCPQCHQPRQNSSPTRSLCHEAQAPRISTAFRSMAHAPRQLHGGELVTVLSWIDCEEAREKALSLGLTRALLEGERVRLEECSERASLAVMVDVFRYDSGSAFRLEESMTLARTLGKAELLIDSVQHLARCANCGGEVEESPQFALVSCDGCGGRGRVRVFVSHLLVPVPEWTTDEIQRAPGGFCELGGDESSSETGARGGRVFASLSEAEQQAFLFGVSGERRFILEEPSQSERGGVAGRLRNALRHTRVKNLLRALTAEEECTECCGSGYRESGVKYSLCGKSFSEVWSLSLSEAREFFSKCGSSTPSPFLDEGFFKRAERLGIGHLTLNRPLSTLSSSEVMRLLFAIQPPAVPLLLLFDEPSVGLHRDELNAFLDMIEEGVALGGTAVVVDHCEAVVQRASERIVLGPGGGVHGGRIVQREVAPVESRGEQSEYRNAESVAPSCNRDTGPGGDRKKRSLLSFSGITKERLDCREVSLPLGGFTVVVGRSGSGKTTFLREVVRAPLERLLRKRELGGETVFTESEREWLGVSSVTGWESVSTVTALLQGRSRGVVVSPVAPLLRELYALTPAAKVSGLSPKSLSAKKAPCSACSGVGRSSTHTSCSLCGGSGVSRALDHLRFKGVSLREVYFQTVEEGEQLFTNVAFLRRFFRMLSEVGLGYLVLGQPIQTLSLGERQRFELARVAMKNRSPLRRSSQPKTDQHGSDQQRGTTVFLFEEVSRGLGSGELGFLLRVLRALTESGHTIIAEESDSRVIAAADCVIELGISR